MENRIVDLKILIVGMSLVLAIIFDILFFDRTPGLSVPIYALLLVNALFLISKFYDKSISKQTLTLIGCAVFFAVMVAFRASPTLMFFNIVATLGLLLLVTESAVGKMIKNMLVANYIRAVVLQPIIFMVKGLRVVAQAFSDRTQTTTGTKVFKGLIIAVPVVAIFVMLFSSADMVFGKYIQNIFSFDIGDDVMAHVFIITLGTVFLAGAYAMTTYLAAETLELKLGIPKIRFGKIELITVLSLVNLVFLLFVLLQINYLFGGQGMIVNSGFTYAEYARKGFLELIWVAILSFGVIYFSDKFKSTDEGSVAPVKWLNLALSGFVMVIVISALKRLGLYIDAYGMSEIRFYSAGMILFLFCLYITLAFILYKEKGENRLTHSALVLMISFLAIINLMNPDRFITKSNIYLLEKNGKLDTSYLMELSPDAILEVMKFVLKGENEHSNALARDLYYKQHDEDFFPSDFQSWNYGKVRAKNILDTNAQLLEKYK